MQEDARITLEQNEKLALQYLEERNFVQLRSVLDSMEPADIAHLLDEAPEEDLLLLFRVLPKELAADTFAEMDSDEAMLLINAFSDSELENVFSQLFADDTVDFLEEMPASVVRRILSKIPPERRAKVNELMKYPPESAGSAMTIEYVDLTADMTVGETLKRIRRTGLKKESVYNCYVVDDYRHLIGDLTALDLLTHEEDEQISDIMNTSTICVETMANKEEAGRLFKKYDLLALPVVDKEKRLVGIITVDDALDVIDEATEEDFAKMAAMQPIENTYFKTSVFSHAKKRIVWLLVLMISATVSGMIITHYQEAFASIPLLVAFLPMLMDTGGNCGSQASTLIIRGLAVDEIHLRDYGKALWKELRIALLVGCTLAIVSFLRVLIQYHNPGLGFVLGITILCTVLFAKILGCTLPMLARKIGLDPAIMASPLITTLCDCFTVFLYFKIATVVFGL